MVSQPVLRRHPFRCRATQPIAGTGGNIGANHPRIVLRRTPSTQRRLARELRRRTTNHRHLKISNTLFGIGFGLAAYCPGTGAAAIGQGNFDALAMVAGMLAGSYLFAEASGLISRNIDPIGDCGKVTLYDWVPGSRMLATIAFATILVGVLLATEWLA